MYRGEKFFKLNTEKSILSSKIENGRLGIYVYEKLKHHPISKQYWLWFDAEDIWNFAFKKVTEVMNDARQEKNITQSLRKKQGLKYNTDEIIDIFYDIQAGSYVSAAVENVKLSKHLKNYTSELVRTILSLCKPASILEAGVGEATTLSGVLQGLDTDIDSFGFDLSWSRIAWAKRWLQSKQITTTLCTGSFFNIPFADNSIDLVYTSHSIEPNGGKEAPILRELFRITRKYLILLEPGYELANDEIKQRMDTHRYCKNLKGIAESLGFNVLAHNIYPFIWNPLNPTAITIIEKQTDAAPPAFFFACPKFKTPMKKIGNVFYSPEALMIYPIIDGIPCLRIENGILASKYEEIVGMT